MRKLFGILFLIFLSSQGHAQNLKQRILDEGFLVNDFEDAEVLQLNEIKRIKTFQNRFWQKDSLIKDFRFIIPFDFGSRQISKNSPYGIPVEGLPVGCLIYDCSMRWVKILLHSKIDFELLFDEGGLETTIEKNILNDGYLPYFAETPEYAYTEIRIPKKLKIKKTEYILSRITEIYLDLIEKKITEENMEIQEALEKYPIKIMLTTLTKPPKLKNKELIEIKEEIEVDLEN